MTKREMFLKAHKIARKILSASDNYAIAFAFALMRVWKMLKQGCQRVTAKRIAKAVFDLTHQPQAEKIDGVDADQVIELF